MIITYRKKTKEIVMLGQAVDNNSLASLEVADDPRFSKGYRLTFENNQVVFHKSPAMENKNKQQKMKQDFDKDMQKINDAVNDKDKLKELLETFAKKIYNQ